MIRKTLGVVLIICAFIFLCGGIQFINIKSFDHLPFGNSVVYKGVMGPYDVYIGDDLNNGFLFSTIWLEANNKSAGQYLIIGDDYENDGRLDAIVIYSPPKKSFFPPQIKKRWKRSVDQKSPTDPEMALAELQLVNAVLAIHNEKHLHSKLEDGVKIK